MTIIQTTVAEAYVLVADFTGKYVRQVILTREEETTLSIAYSESASVPQFILTPSFLGIEIQANPSGGKIYAKTNDSGKTSSVVVNWT